MTAHGYGRRAGDLPASPWLEWAARPQPEQPERILPAPPAGWFVALDGYGQPCIWAPGDSDDRPVCLLIERINPEVFAYLAPILPNRTERN